MPPIKRCHPLFVHERCHPLPGNGKRVGALKAFNAAMSMPGNDATACGPLTARVLKKDSRVT